MKIKVCGLKNVNSIKAVEKLNGVDFTGFIFYEKSPRYVGELANIPVKPSSIQRVGVFVNSTVDEMLAFAKKFELDAIQLHGNESNAICKSLKSAGYQVIKVISMRDEADLATTSHFDAQFVDYFLFDTKTVKHGGSGKKFNWELLSGYTGEVPFFLSGGISQEDVKTIQKIKHKKLVGVDINSKFEVAPGEKNVELIEEFLGTLRC